MVWPATHLSASSQRPVAEKMMVIEGEEPLAFASLPVDVLCSVTENLDVQSLARFAAACSACRAAAQSRLRDALLPVLRRCLRGTPSGRLCTPSAPTVSAWEKATFIGCNLKSLSLLGLAVGTSSIGENAFYKCSSLSRCVLTPDITTISRQAFRGCTRLTEITLPATLTNIDEGAFRDCSSLTSLTFPASLTTIENHAFWGCSSLTHLDLSAPTAATIGFDAFSGCERLVKLTLPAALSRIEKWTFRRCSALVELTLPAALNCIDQLAFEECTSLTTVIFPATLRLTYVGVTKPPWAHTRHTPWKPCTPIETVHLSYLKNTPCLLAAESAFSRCT